MSEKLNVLVVGAGTMGAGIATVWAMNGFQVALNDISQEQLDKAKKSISANMDFLLKEEMATPQQAENARTLVTYELDLAKCAPQANLVVESVFENPKVKADTYVKLDKLCTPECIFASNTSGMNVFDVAPVSNPERMLITHWFNPPFVMDLVEVVMGPKTTEKTVDKVITLLKQLGKKPSLIKHYIPGFIVNRMATVLTREAGYMISQGWTTAQDIDSALRETAGIRYAFEGPLALNDIVGWDLVTTVSGDVNKTLCNDEIPYRLGTELIKQGNLGLKSGKGVYDYSDMTPQEFMENRSGKIVRMVKAIKELDLGIDKRIVK